MMEPEISVDPDTAEGSPINQNQNSEDSDIVGESGPQEVVLPSNAPFPTMVVETMSCLPIGQVQVGRYAMDKLFALPGDPQEWVGRIPPVLNSCQIELRLENEIESVLITKDSLRWTNVCLLEESYITFPNFPRFASQIGPQIQILKLDKFFGSIPEITFISCCLSLKTLTIKEMDVRRSPRMLLPSEFPNLGKTFGGVKILSVEDILFDQHRQLEFFKNFLNRFPKLERMSIPRPHGPSQTEWETMKTFQLKYLIKPVIDYLNTRQNNMNLPVNPIRRNVNAGGVFSTVFAELAQSCAKNGAFLTHVRQKQIQNLFLTQDSVLGKILYLADGINDRRLLTRWVNLEKVCLKTSACDVRSEPRGGKIPLFPNLKSIHFIFDSDSRIDPGFTGLNRLLHLMIGQTRGSVKELIIQWAIFGHDTPAEILDTIDIVKRLPNVVKLHANNWKVQDEDFITLLEGMKHLQHLALEDCAEISEVSFLGKIGESSPLSQLQELKCLEIVNRVGSNSVTDASFIQVFSTMKLTTFVFDVSPNLVSMNGYKSLAEGTIADHIEIFPEPKFLPFGCTKITFDEFRKALLRLH